jgi:glutathione S-transferase
MTDIILHHYANSPFSEKVRAGFGLKRLAWRSVDIPPVMPKPDLIPLTGGYRKTPVLQIGADIYCDTQLIMREIDRRFPMPSFYPGGKRGEADALAWWIDRNMFGPAVTVAFSVFGESLPQAFKDDRAKFSGRNFDVAAMKRALPGQIDQLRAHLAWAEAMLANGRPFMLGAEPGLVDLALYNPLWFVARAVQGEASPLREFPRLLAWMDRMKGLGAGTPTPLSSKDALAVARDATPEAPPVAADDFDPAGRKIGDAAMVTPDDTGRDPVAGKIVGLSPWEIVIARDAPEVGRVHVHFPRAGFVVQPA